MNHGLDTDTEVFFYEPDFYVLSNFSAFEVIVWGHQFKTAEHAYQFAKFTGSPDLFENDAHYDIAERVKAASSAHDAYQIAQQHELERRLDWLYVRVGKMAEILAAKTRQHAYVRKKLLDTGGRTLIENSWRDGFWGWGHDREGKNTLGRLWMDLRAELRRPAGT